MIGLRISDVSLRKYRRVIIVPRDTSKRPSRTYQTKPFSTKSEWHEVRYDDLRQCDNPTSANPLDGPSHQHVGEILSNRSDNRSHKEEDKGYQDHGFTAKDVRERSEIRL